MPDIAGLRDDLRRAGVDIQQAGPLNDAARRGAGEWSQVRAGLPVQLIHGDLAPGNALVDERTGRITALLDFEFAGVGHRAQDVVAALFNAGALDGHDWLPVCRR